jgi:hypothetical protein
MIKLVQKEDALDETFAGSEGDSHSRRAFAASTSVVRRDVSHSQGHGPSSTPDYVAQFMPTTGLCSVFHNPIVDLIGDSSGTWTLASLNPDSGEPRTLLASRLLGACMNGPAFPQYGPGIKRRDQFLVHKRNAPSLSISLSLSKQRRGLDAIGRGDGDFRCLRQECRDSRMEP